MTLEQKKQKLFKELASISMLCELIKIYYVNSVQDTRFRNPRIADKASKIQSFADSIQKRELKDAVRVLPNHADEMANEHALQLWRIMDYFMFMPTAQLEEFAEGLEKMEVNDAK